MVISISASEDDELGELVIQVYIYSGWLVVMMLKIAQHLSNSGTQELRNVFVSAAFVQRTSSYGVSSHGLARSCCRTETSWITIIICVSSASAGCSYNV